MKIKLIVLILLVVFFTACTTSEEPKMLFKPSTPFDIDNRSIESQMIPYGADCIHNVVCYRYYGNRITCTYTEAKIKECEQQ